MRFRNGLGILEKQPAPTSEGFLLRKPHSKHQRCDKPSFTPWSPAEDKFGRGTLWQCPECHRIYLTTGNEPVVGGFWQEISKRSARRILKRRNNQLIYPHPESSLALSGNPPIK